MDSAGSEKRWHIFYIGVIVVLTITLIVVLAKVSRVRSDLHDTMEAFGIRPGFRAGAPRREPLRDSTDEDLSREKSYGEYRAEVDDLVARAQELGEFGDHKNLSEACAYALDGGKRLRPIIVLEVGRAAAIASGSRPVDLGEVALFAEYVHTASLVVDDLPAFDDDEERRGQESLHAKWDPATAQMASLALVSGAFQCVGRQTDWIRDNRRGFRGVDQIGTRLCHETGKAMGASGAAGGQLLDTTAPRGGEGEVELAGEIVQKKTATFFELAFLAGWLFGGGDWKKSDEVQEAGRHFGVAFQIADDVGDLAQDEARRARGKPGWNYASVYGAVAARREIRQNLNACRLVLTGLDIYTPLWREMYDKVLGMMGDD